MAFAVFLDIDGVLNTRTTCERTDDYSVGIDDERVKILSDAMSHYKDAKLVLSSDWKMLKEHEGDYIYLVNKLAKRNLSIYGKTVDMVADRGNGIVNYLKEHPEIDEYVVIDDRKFDFEDFDKVWERLLFTDSKGIENSRHIAKYPAVEAIEFLDYIKEASGD